MNETKSFKPIYLKHLYGKVLNIFNVCTMSRDKLFDNKLRVIFFLVKFGKKICIHHNFNFILIVLKNISKIRIILIIILFMSAFTIYETSIQKEENKQHDYKYT